MRIEEAAARTQARIDTGKQTITGVNKFKIDGDAKINLLKVDNVAGDTLPRLSDLGLTPASVLAIAPTYLGRSHHHGTLNGLRQSARR